MVDNFLTIFLKNKKFIIDIFCSFLKRANFRIKKILKNKDKIKIK
jgi:hypothetical protein